MIKLYYDNFINWIKKEILTDKQIKTITRIRRRYNETNN